MCLISVKTHQPLVALRPTVVLCVCAATGQRKKWFERRRRGDTKESVSGGGGDGASSFDCGPMADWYTTTNAEMLGRVC